MKARFDFVAPFYDRLAQLVFGDLLLKAQKETIKKLGRRSSILVIGGGTGAIIPEILDVCRPERLIFVEDSAEMLWRAYVANRESSNVVQFVLGDESYLKDLKDIDVVCTFFFLDVFSPIKLKEVMRNLYHTLGPQAHWACVDFNADSKSWFHRALVKIMLIFFGLFSQLPAKRLLRFDDYFKELGMKVEEEMSYGNGLVFGKVWGKEIFQKDTNNHHSEQVA